MSQEVKEIKAELLSEKDMANLKELHSWIKRNFTGGRFGGLLVQDATASLGKAICRLEALDNMLQDVGSWKK